MKTKKILAIMAALCLMASGCLAGCGRETAAGAGEPDAAEETATEAAIDAAEEAATDIAEESKEAYASGEEKASMTGGAMIPNPWVDCESKEQAEDLAGFKIDTDPAQVDGASSIDYRVLGGESAALEERMIEAIYRSASGDEVARIRKQRSFESDISGDFNIYSYGIEADYDWGSISAAGTGSKAIKKASWQTIEDGAWNSYSLTVEGEGWDFSYVEKLVISIIADVISKDLAPVPKDQQRDPSKATLQPAPVSEDDKGASGTESGGSAPVSAGLGLQSAGPGLQSVAEEGPKENPGNPESNYAVDPVSGQEYSSRTVIIAVEQKFTEEELAAFLEKYDLELKYDYDSFNMYAMSFKEDKSYEELKAFADRVIAENENLLSCELDAVTRLTDPVAPSVSIY